MVKRAQAIRDLESGTAPEARTQTVAEFLRD